jgi:kynureninase
MDSPQIELGPFPQAAGYDEAVGLDSADPLADFADRFAHPDADLIYLDGNSLGRLPLASSERLRTVADVEWGEQLIRSWRNRWWGLAAEIGNKLAPLVGAGADEVVIADSTSVALYKLALGGLLARPGRNEIITDDTNFPTDNYVLAAAAKLTGGSVVTVTSSDGVHGPEDAIIGALDEETALLSLSHVTFKSGYLYDMHKLTAAAHAVGALVVWDLSHSVGVVPVDLEGDGVDLAVGCTYKYLNSGPGAPAFLYVSKERASEVENPLTGWWGHREPFAFDLDYHPTESITRFNTGTMPILSLVPVEHGVALTAEASMQRIRAKSVAMTTFFIEQAKRRLLPLGFQLASPPHPSRRGSHVSLRHARAWPVVQAMIEYGKIIPDFREPDNIRFGFAPLYTSFRDVHTAIGRIVEIVEKNIHASFPTDRRRVT